MRIAEPDGRVIVRRSYTCPHCGAVSYNAHDILHGYCGRCHLFMDDELSLSSDGSAGEASEHE